MKPYFKNYFKRLYLVFILCLVATSTLQGVPQHASAASWSSASHYSEAVPETASVKLSWRLGMLADTTISLRQSKHVTEMLGVPETGPGSLVQNDNGAVLTYIRVVDTSRATIQAIKSLGAEIIHISPQYNIVTAYVIPDRLHTTAELNQVANVQEVLHMQSDNIGISPAYAGSAQPTSCVPGIVSEGDDQLKAAAARAAFGIDGSGIIVGALSDSYNLLANEQSGATNDVTNGELPGPGNPCGYTTPVEVIAEPQASSSSDEGRAMLHIIHDLAPGAKLKFATAYGGMFAFADNIRKLKQAGSHVIVDDVSYLQEPFYQDGPVSVAVKDVTEQGAIYFKAVGNANAIDSAGNMVGSYEAGYRPMPCPALAFPVDSSDCHAFNSATSDATMGITLGPGGGFTMVLQWAQPWYGVETNLDLFVVNQQGAIVGRSTNVNTGPNGTQIPYESLAYTNSSGEAQVVQFVIARKSGPAVEAFKYILVRSSNIISTEYNSTNSYDMFGPTVMGHAAAAEALSVGAVRYNNSSMVERFSSQGPATVYFEPVRSTTPSARLATPDVRRKPDLMATNGTRNPFFGSLSGGVYRFYGTSAAAPHAAAVAALMLERAAQIEPTLNSSYSASLMMKTASFMVEHAARNETEGLIDALEVGYAFAPPGGASRWSVYLPHVGK